MKPLPPARLIVAVLDAGSFDERGRGAHFDVVCRTLENDYGPLAYASSALDFTWTSYYQAEMGALIKRYFLAFDRPVDPAALARIKVRTNEIEALMSVGESGAGGRTLGESAASRGLLASGRADRPRCVNLDPGLLYPSRLILATTKDRAHRIPLADGIFAELTLIYEKKDFRPLPWTYPDYADESCRSIMREIRALDLNERRKRHHECG